MYVMQPGSWREAGASSLRTSLIFSRSFSAKRMRTVKLTILSISKPEGTTNTRHGKSSQSYAAPDKDEDRSGHVPPFRRVEGGPAVRQRGQAKSESGHQSG